jgi:hypothetical protein
VCAIAVTCLALAVVGVASATRESPRRPAPKVTGVALDGRKVSLRGKPVFINVWSSW